MKSLFVVVAVAMVSGCRDFRIENDVAEVGADADSAVVVADSAVDSAVVVTDSASTDGGTVKYVGNLEATSCKDCWSVRCKDEYAACQADGSLCLQLLTCYNGCSTTPCAVDCYNKNTSTPARAFLKCVSKCEVECAG